MIDSGNSKDWRPNPHLQAGYEFPFEYRFVTHVDQTHVSIVHGLALPTVETKVLYRNPSYTEAQFREMKARSGPLTKDGEWYAAACSSHSTSAIERFNEHMDGITATTFWNRYPAFTNPNDLSLAVFIKYAGFSILFPGDLEKPGWLALLEDPAFREELGQVTILVASHQGREKGFCREVFRYCKPRAVVVSNKPVNHSSREVLPGLQGCHGGRRGRGRNALALVHTRPHPGAPPCPDNRARRLDADCRRPRWQPNVPVPSILPDHHLARRAGMA